MLLFSKNIILS